MNERQAQERKMDPEFFLDYTLYLLHNFYSHFHPNVDENSFVRDIYLPYLNDENTSGLNLSNEYEPKIGKKPADMVNIALRISCAYCAQAKRELNSKREASWVYITYAMHWCGIAQGGLGLTAVTLGNFETDIKSKLAKKYSAIRTETWVPLKEEAFRLVIAKYPTPDGWPTYRAAAKAIAKEVFELSKQLKIELSEERLEKTIAEWIAKMPDKSKYFPNATMHKHPLNR